MTEFIKQHREEDPRQLALQAQRYPDIDMREAVVQISGWQTARKKLPLWAATEGVVFPEHLSMEQCSSQQTAEYKASLALSLLDPLIRKDEEVRMTDLTGGFGVDASMMALRLNAHLTFVERNERLCEIARNNLPLLGVTRFEVKNSDGTEELGNLPQQTLIYIDPARRDEHGGKTVAISDCTPDISSLEGLMKEKAEWTMVKLSPMIDLASIGRTLKEVAEIHIVSVEGECKEVLVLMRKGWAEETAVVCANIGKDGKTLVLRADEANSQCCYATSVGKYLYEPNASIMKACAFKSVAQQYGVAKLHPSSHLYTSDTLVEVFPGRRFEVEGWSTFAKKELRQFLGSIKKANLTVRNFPSTVADLRKRLKIAEGGDVYLFATTLADDSHIVIRCRKAASVQQ